MLTPLRKNKTCQFLSKTSERVKELKHGGSKSNLFLAIIIRILMPRIFLTSQAGAGPWGI
jgi:hypothetical protein